MIYSKSMNSSFQKAKLMTVGGASKFLFFLQAALQSNEIFYTSTKGVQ